MGYKADTTIYLIGIQKSVPLDECRAFPGTVELHTVALTFGSPGHRFDPEVIKMHGVLCHGGFAFSLLEFGFTMGEIDFYATAAATHRSSHQFQWLRLAEEYTPVSVADFRF